MMNCGHDLRWFLFDEYQEMYIKEGIDVHSLILSYLDRYAKLYKNPLIKIALKTLRANFRTFSPLISTDDKKILFQNGIGRYDSIITESSKRNAIILGVRKSALWDFLSRKTMYYPVFDSVYLDLNLGIINNNEEQLQKSICKLTEVFEYLNPDVLILNDDALPPSRALLLVSKELNIPTIEIQHGLYQSQNIIPTGKYSDYVFVWGEYFKKLYLDKGIKEKDKIKVLGNPYELQNNFNLNNRINGKNVYYLGQNFEDYNSELLDLKLETITELDKLCNKLKLNFIYRPHPQENRGFLKSKLPNVKFTSKWENLLDSFKKGTIFISFNSTTIVEAALCSKICIQLKNYPIPSDNFEKLGICPTFYNLDEIEDYLKNLLQSQFYTWKVDSKYIEIPNPDPGTKFLELVNDII